jgi:glucose/arabinose dehydrogenase
VGLRDTDGDGRTDQQEWFNNTFGTGIAIRGDYLYYSTHVSVHRYKLTPGQLKPEGAAETIIEGFPEQRSHRPKSFAFDDSGHMYVNVGAPSNACQEKSRSKGSPGMRPCPQLQRQASIWRFDAEKAGQTQQNDGHQYVKGIRVGVALAWSPESKAIYMVQHGRDQLNTLWPDYYDDKDNAELPSEEFFRLEDGANFGWPYCYHDRFQGKKLLAPEYGGDGKKVGECSQYGLPILAFPGHWAPNDLVFYTGEQFPEKYKNGAFVAFHGSWNRAPLPQGGYNVVFVAMKDGRPVSQEWEVLADGFAGRSPLERPRDAQFRPTGLAQGPDGSLYLSETEEGRIWRIVYKGS